MNSTNEDSNKPITRGNIERCMDRVASFVGKLCYTFQLN